MEHTISLELERLLGFARAAGLIGEYDVVPCRNALLDLLGLERPYDGPAAAAPASAHAAMTAILDYAAAAGLIGDGVAERDLMDARIMGLLMPRASETIGRFEALYAQSPETATDWFYALSRDVNYIQVERLKKNRHWLTDTEYGALEITVNLSKPEKDPKEIARAKAAPQSGYPLCLLCRENAGFAGHAAWPARQNLRLIPLELQGERWFLQYSPYLYYNEHCIVLNEQHTPMKLTADSLRRLFQFVERFPHYFIGSNADLPIVGGSILTHDHFQGGRHVFPMEKAADEAVYAHPDFPGVEIVRIRWPMTALRIRRTEPGASYEAPAALAWHMLETWRGYSDREAGIFAFTRYAGTSYDTPHNTVTPIVRKNAAGCWEIDIVLRNNRCSAEHPDGIFHPHAPLHHIKKENIGLIEVMGLAVLPGRLSTELAAVERVLCGGEAGADVSIHADWIDELTARYGRDLTPERAHEIVRREVGEVYRQVLEDCGVFKRTDAGGTQLDRYMAACGFIR